MRTRSTVRFVPGANRCAALRRQRQAWPQPVEKKLAKEKLFKKMCEMRWLASPSW
jgi:hypothetical protein